MLDRGRAVRRFYLSFCFGVSLVAFVVLIEVFVNLDLVG